MLRFTTLFPPRFFALLSVIMLLAFASVAYAADGATPTSTVDLGWFAQFVMSYVAPAIGVIVSLGLGHVYVMLKAKFGVDIDAAQRDALQTAITNAAGLLIAKGAHIADGKTINVGNPAFAQALSYVTAAAPGALDHFGLGPNDVAQKIIAKIGTMSGAPATPTITAADAAAPAPAPAAAAVTATL